VGVWSKLFGGRRAGEAKEEPEESRAVSSSEGDADEARLSFLETVAEKLRAASEDLDFSRDVPAFALRVRSGKGAENAMFLENLFAESRDLSPEAREELISRFVGVFAAAATEPTPPPGWEAARGKLVLCLRAATFSPGGGVGDDRLVLRPCLPMLVEVVALDAPDAIHYVSRTNREEWKVTPAELFAEAQATLSSVETRLEMYDPEAGYPLWHVANDDNYEASRLITPGWLASLSGRVNGRPVAIVPHSRLLIVGGAGDDDCVARLVEVARREYESSPRSVSPALYTVDGAGKVVPFHLPGGHSLASEVERGHRALEQVEYAHQKKALESSAPDREDVAFVASYTLLKGGDGTFISYATWAKSVSETLIPQVDRIAIGMLGKGAFMAPFHIVRSLEPPCLAQEPGMYPPRYRTVRWPSDAELQALKEASA
jgi:uncharacterized protein YtpQ (UPF0354 family)